MYATSQKIKRRLNKFLNVNDIEYYIKNITLNGQPHGCSGFIYYKPTKVLVYLTTDMTCCFSGKNEVLVRYARNTKDYVGATNQYTSDDNVGMYLKKMLVDANAYRNVKYR